MQVQNHTHHPGANVVGRVIQYLAVTIVCLQGSNLQAQEATADAKTKPVPVDQTKLVRAIYDATKSARTTKDFTAFLKQCDEALAIELSTENRKYVVSLSGWGLNRRGEKHFEMAVQLKRIGNDQHESAMKEALKDFDAAIVAAPERYRSWLSRGIAHVANEKYENAILDFTKVTKLKADEPNGWFNRAEAFYHRGNFEPAIRDYDAALRLNSDDAQALTGRGLSAYSLGKFAEALTDFEQVLQLHPKNDAAYLNRGDVHQALGKWELAMNDYSQAIKIKETGAAYQRSAWLKATCPDSAVQDSKQAKKLIDQAIALAGYTASNLDTLAAAEAANGDFDSAKTTQQKVIGLVNAEAELETEQYQARLTLYEKSEPFVQQIEESSDAKKPSDSPDEQDDK